MMLILFLCTFSTILSLNAAELFHVPPFTIAVKQHQVNDLEQQCIYYVSGPTTWEQYTTIARRIIGLQPKKMQAPHDGYLAGIFDGHGDNGKQAAHAVRKLMSYYFAHTKPENSEDIPTFITRVFKSVDEDIKQNHKTWADANGSTALIFYYDQLNNLLYTAWCGNSCATWGKENNELTAPHSLKKRAQETFNNNKNKVSIGVDITRGFGDLSFMTAMNGTDASHTNEIFTSIPEIKSINMNTYSSILGGSHHLFNQENAVMSILYNVTDYSSHLEKINKIFHYTGSEDNKTGVSIQYAPEAKPLEYNIQRIRAYCAAVLLLLGIGSSYTYLNFFKMA